MDSLCAHNKGGDECDNNGSDQDSKEVANIGSEVQIIADDQNQGTGSLINAVNHNPSSLIISTVTKDNDTAASPSICSTECMDAEPSVTPLQTEKNSGNVLDSDQSGIQSLSLQMDNQNPPIEENTVDDKNISSSDSVEDEDIEDTNYFNMHEKANVDSQTISESLTKHNVEPAPQNTGTIATEADSEPTIKQDMNKAGSTTTRISAPENQKAESGLTQVFMEYRDMSDAEGDSVHTDSSDSISSDDESGADPDSACESSDEDRKSKRTNSRRDSEGDQKKKGLNLIRTKGELQLEDLMPIKELKIAVDDNVTLAPIGEVSSCVGVLVIVHANRGIPALDEDTILFLEGRQVLGQVFETFGPVVTPFYAVRFNSPEEIAEKGLKAGLKVFYAPDMTEYTHYVFLSQIQRMRGSDASWEHNNEPPPQCVDYSDDEQEKLAKKRSKHRTQGNKEDGEDSLGKAEGRREGRNNQLRQEGGQPRRPNRNEINSNGPRGQNGPRPRFPSAAFRNPFTKVWPPGSGHQGGPQGGPQGYPGQAPRESYGWQPRNHGPGRMDHGHRAPMGMNNGPRPFEPMCREDTPYHYQPQHIENSGPPQMLDRRFMHNPQMPGGGFGVQTQGPPASTFSHNEPPPSWRQFPPPYPPQHRVPTPAWARQQGPPY